MSVATCRMPTTCDCGDDDALTRPRAATRNDLVRLPPRSATAAPAFTSVWPLEDFSSVNPTATARIKSCKLLQGNESDTQIFGECAASSVAPTIDAKVRRSSCCKDQIKPDRNLLSQGIVRDIIIGLSDGLMVPFALTAGLSSLGSSRLVYQGGFAELISGALSMGIGGYLSAKSEQDIFRHRLSAITNRLNVACPSEIKREIHEVLSPFGVKASVSRLVAESLEAVQQEQAVDKDNSAFLRVTRRRKQAAWGTSAFLIQLGEGMEEVPTLRLFASAFTIGLSYFLGGLIPIVPYLCVPNALHALYWSMLATGITLLLFGLAKSWFTGAATGVLGLIWGAISMLAVGAAAAAASYGIVKALSRAHTS